jgi:hypothetical protein
VDLRDASPGDARPILLGPIRANVGYWHAMHRLVLVALLISSPAFADKKHPVVDARVELADFVAKTSSFTGKVINIPGPLDTKPSEVYACGHAKKQWVALELVDGGQRLVAYCPRGKVPGCAMLEKPSSIMHAVVKLAACKQTIVEVLDF